MRIIAGKYKNRKIETKNKNFQTTDLRPTLGKTREAIFAVLEYSKWFDHNLALGATVLDLCCGSGSFGIEAISRGADRVTFVDNNNYHLKIARHNIKKFSEEERSDFVCCDAAKFTSTTQYDIIYIDAPYHINITDQILNNIAKENILKNMGIVLVELSKKVALPVPDFFKTLDERRYGTTKVTFLKKDSDKN